MRGFADLRSSILKQLSASAQIPSRAGALTTIVGPEARGTSKTNSWVLMLSNGVTARSDSVNPAPNPAITVRGPDIFPFSS
jgi:hypothetical protein